MDMNSTPENRLATAGCKPARSARGRLSSAWLHTALAALLLPLAAAALAQSAPQAAPAAPALRSITFFVAPPPQPAASGVDARAVPELDVPALRDALGSRLGQPLTGEGLIEILGLVNAQLARSGERFRSARFPEQDLSEGRLVIQVTQARVGDINVRAIRDQPGKADSIRRLLRVKPGDVLVQQTLDDDVEWINRSNPYRSAQVIAQPGRNVGETNLELLIDDRRPYGFSLAYDNNGTRVTGRDRVTFSAGWGNAFGLGHQLSYTLNANQKPDRFASHSVGYVIPLEWRHLLSLSANVAEINPDLPVPFNQVGKSAGFGARYDIPLRGGRAFSHGANAGFDYKRSDNNLLFSQTPVSNTLTEIFQFSAGYSVTLRDAWGQTAAGLTWIHSPGGLGNSNSDAAFNASRAGATARYDYQTLNIERNTRLPEEWSWMINLRVQRASNNLLGSEQLAAGGFNSVRGFAEAVVFGDEGQMLRTELKTPLRNIEIGNRASRVQGLLFYDAARVSNKNLLPGEVSVSELSSWGVGLRAALPAGLSLRVDAGKQLTVNVPGTRPGHLVHVGLSAAF
ncbi:MAG: ShlB/FhaC/HecB family hemolysin secretion/activation protein [bacterium]|jgi:hemolysin activation/secretion protein